MCDLALVSECSLNTHWPHKADPQKETAVPRPGNRWQLPTLTLFHFHPLGFHEGNIEPLLRVFLKEVISCCQQFERVLGGLDPALGPD